MSAHERVLEGETAIVTGASRGIGRAVALVLARAGARLVLAARSSDELLETVREAEAYSTVAIGVPTDVASRAAVDALVARAVEATGRVDIVVNNAGVFLWKALANLDEDEWDRILDTNLKASYLLIHAALPYLMKGGRGRIVNVASIHGTVGDANVVAHCAAKFGLIGLTKALARELREAGVTVNAVCPGSTENRLRETLDVRRQFPLKEKLTGRDVAEAVLFLVSPAASAISGTILDVWGGTHVAIRG